MGVIWILKQFYLQRGCCLADDMGLGKTLQTIAVLLHLKNELVADLQTPKNNKTNSAAPQLDIFGTVADRIMPLRALIILPASLLVNWQLELQRFAPSFIVGLHVGPKRVKDKRVLANFDILLSSYHTVREDKALLGALSFTCIVLDESQQIKNPASEITKAIRGLDATNRLALSGTPIENSLTELWSLVEFLNPKMLGSAAAFKRQFVEPIEKEKNQNAKSLLKEKIQDVFLRRTKAEVAPELPPLSRQVVQVVMDTAQAQLYEKTRSAMRNTLLGISDEGTFRLSALQALMQLRKIAGHPRLSQPDFETEGAKFELVISQWEQLTSQGSKVLIFSSFEQHIFLYRDYFNAKGIPFSIITGRVPVAERGQEVKKFETQEKVQTFLLTLKAGGAGLNLTAANYVFILDPWWNPQVEEQAMARAHRIGQQKPVHAFRFISKDTVEEKMLTLQADKLEIGAGLLDETLPQLDIAALKLLFS